MNDKFISIVLLFIFCLGFSCSKTKHTKMNCREVCEIDNLNEMNKIFASFSTEKQFDFAVSCTYEEVCRGDSESIGFESWLIRNKGIDSKVLEKLEVEEDKFAQIQFLNTIVILNTNHELELKGRTDIAKTAKKIADEMTYEPLDIISIFWGETRPQQAKSLAKKIEEKTKID